MAGVKPLDMLVWQPLMNYLRNQSLNMQILKMRCVKTYLDNPFVNPYYKVRTNI